MRTRTWHEVDRDRRADRREELVERAHVVRHGALLGLRKLLQGVDGRSTAPRRIGRAAIGCVARDDQADHVGLQAVVLIAAEVASEVLGEELQRQHVLRGVADAQPRHQGDVAVAPVTPVGLRKR